MAPGEWWRVEEEGGRVVAYGWMDVVWGDSSYLAQLEIRDAQGMRRVTYYPASSEAAPAPQYTAASVRACAPTNW